MGCRQATPLRLYGVAKDDAIERRLDGWTCALSWAFQWTRDVGVSMGARKTMAGHGKRFQPRAIEATSGHRPTHPRVVLRCFEL